MRHVESDKSNKLQIVRQPDSEVEAADEAIAEPPSWVPEDVGEQITVIPAEYVALHSVALPVRSARQRKAALPFALEDALGAPLEDAHIAVLETHRDVRVLAGVVAKSWFSDLMSRALDKPVVPEQMLLPVPRDDSGHASWTVHCADGRALVRVSDGTGFATVADMLPLLWHRAQKPPITQSGDPLPDGMTPKQTGPAPNPDAADLKRFDMCQGAFRPALGLEKPVKLLAASVVLAIIGHLGLAMADIQAQSATADTLRDAAATALEARLPGASVDDAPALLQRQIAAVSAPQVGSGFLTLMQDVSQAWLQDGTPIQFRDLAWSDDALRLVVEAPDLDALQRAEAVLATNGLSVSSGSATAGAGSARADFSVRP